ncbi:MAG: hypothetical protein DWQ35_17800 [Planctomycetota bacterium]|nr:MAG: hypothetical protein DWQ35_17800 [Planctomycetota bacterium]REK47333.1 MAG: hypothetical protein DWQ46_04470 [Planctomycetota bacterium]
MALNQWSIPSNSGRYHVQFEVTHCDETGDFEYAVELCGMYVDPDRSLASSTGAAKIFQIRLYSVPICRLASEELLDRLQQWLDKYDPFVVALATGPTHKMELEVAPRDDLLTSTDKPALTILHNAAYCRFEVYFVVDPTCILQAAEQLQQVLANHPS